MALENRNGHHLRRLPSFGHRFRCPPNQVRGHHQRPERFRSTAPLRGASVSVVGGAVMTVITGP